MHTRAGQGPPEGFTLEGSSDRAGPDLDDRTPGSGAGERIGPYQLVRRIGSGGMAELFLARQVGPDGFVKRVALKRIHAHLAHDEELSATFRDEARIVAQLAHPHIVQILDLGRHEGRDYIVMEHVAGRDLAAIAARSRALGRPPPAPFVARCLAQVCEALHHAHTRRDEGGRPLGIVHRDVSPQNVIVTPAGSVKLVDFGIAKAAGRLSRTEAGVLKGKHAYMSPEQARGEPLDPRSDVFALGIVLYELLAGARPFERATALQTLKAIAREAPPPIAHRAPDLPPALVAVIERCLEKAPERRFPTAEAVQLALEDVVRQSELRCSSVSIARWLADLFDEGPTAKADVGRPAFDDARTVAVREETEGPRETAAGRAEPASRGIPPRAVDPEPPALDPTRVDPTALAFDDRWPEPVRLAGPAVGSLVDEAPDDHTLAEGLELEPTDATSPAGPPVLEDRFLEPRGVTTRTTASATGPSTGSATLGAIDLERRAVRRARAPEPEPPSSPRRPEQATPSALRSPLRDYADAMTSPIPDPPRPSPRTPPGARVVAGTPATRSPVPTLGRQIREVVRPPRGSSTGAKVPPRPRPPGRTDLGGAEVTHSTGFLSVRDEVAPLLPTRESSIPPAPRPSPLARWAYAPIALVLALGTFFGVRALVPATARLEVVTRPPGARVWLDGAPMSDRTPMTLPLADPGRRHRVEVRLDGFRVERRDLEPLRTRRVVLDLDLVPETAP